MTNIDKAIEDTRAQLNKLEAMKAEQEAANKKSALLEKVGVKVETSVSDKVGYDLIHVYDKTGKLLYSEYAEKPNAQGTASNPYNYEDVVAGNAPMIEGAWYGSADGTLYVYMTGAFEVI